MSLPEAFMHSLTATERRILEALDPAGGTTPYTAILGSVWPDRTHANPPTYRETQRIRAHRSRLVPKLAAIGWSLPTQEGYGIALQPIAPPAAVPDPPGGTPAVQLGAREARWALRLAEFMAKRGGTADARGESARLENALRLALDGYESERRRRARENNRRYKETHREELRPMVAAASRRYRERQLERAAS